MNNTSQVIGTESDAREIERMLVIKGLTRVDPDGYPNGYKLDSWGLQYKRYYKNDAGEFWVIESYNQKMTKYYIEQLA